jgi:ABC-2 type transport system permease protein
MRATWTICKREVFAFFASPLAYAVITAWLLIEGFSFYLMATWFAANPLQANATDNLLSAFFGQTTLFYLPPLVFVPIITMRLLAEERSRGTIEMLMTAPVRDTSIVLGKYLAALIVWVALWVPTLLYVWLASRYGSVDMGAVGSSYLGVLGIGAYYMAIGTLMSTIAKNQIVAAILTFATLGGLFILGLAGMLLGEEYREILGYISIWTHMEAFSAGIVDSRYLIFDGTVAALAITLAIAVLSARRVEE